MTTPEEFMETDGCSPVSYFVGALHRILCACDGTADKHESVIMAARNFLIISLVSSIDRLSIAKALQGRNRGYYTTPPCGSTRHTAEPGAYRRCSVILNHPGALRGLLV